jgi:hypothetical protein
MIGTTGTRVDYFIFGMAAGLSVGILIAMMVTKL